MRAANILVREYAETINLQVSTDRKGKIREEQRAGPDHQEELMLNSPFAIKELEDALTILKFEKAPGPDKITNEMLSTYWPQQQEQTTAVV